MNSNERALIEENERLRDEIASLSLTSKFPVAKFLEILKSTKPAVVKQLNIWSAAQFKRTVIHQLEGGFDISSWEHWAKQHDIDLGNL